MLVGSGGFTDPLQTALWGAKGLHQEELNVAYNKCNLSAVNVRRGWLR